jgi:hypothetical protein
VPQDRNVVGVAGRWCPRRYAAGVIRGPLCCCV